MVSSQVSFCVVGPSFPNGSGCHIIRCLGGQMFIDYEDRGANFNHRRAVEWANEQNHRVVIVEDDAVLMCDSCVALVNGSIASLTILCRSIWEQEGRHSISQR